MRALQKIKNSPAILFFATIVFFALSFFLHELFIFVAFVPVLVLLDFPFKTRHLILIVPALLLGGFLTGLTSPGPDIVGMLFYVIVVIAVLVFYVVMQRLTQNRLNKLSLVILIIGMEYFLLKLQVPEKAPFFADALQHQTTWVRWNIYTGYLGASTWILLVNLLLYQALFKREKVHIFLLVLGALAVLLPILYSINLTNNALTKEQVIRFYSGDSSGVTNPYLLYGELISRTGAWVSILIIIFTLVRAKTKKVAR